MLDPEHHEELLRALTANGQRCTPQRELVFAVLLGRRDHPSADEVHARARALSPSISLATVYNCLETLVACGLVRQVNHEREPSRFCPNLAPHAHFHDAATGRVVDVELPPGVLTQVRTLTPPGYEVTGIDIHLHGRPAAATGSPPHHSPSQP